MDALRPGLALASPDTDLVRPLLAIGFVLGLLFVFLFLVRRLAASGSLAQLAARWRARPLLRERGSRPRETREVSILGQLALTPTHRLHVVSLRGRDVVVVTHPQGCEWFSLETPGAATFSGVMDEARGQRGR
jgi:flagellar biogenesis protein FliO